MKFAAPTADELRGAVLAGLIVVEVLIACFACLQVYMLGRPDKRSRRHCGAPTGSSGAPPGSSGALSPGGPPAAPPGGPMAHRAPGRFYSVGY